MPGNIIIKYASYGVGVILLSAVQVCGHNPIGLPGLYQSYPLPLEERSGLNGLEEKDLRRIAAMFLHNNAVDIYGLGKKINPEA